MFSLGSRFCQSKFELNVRIRLGTECLYNAVLELEYIVIIVAVSIIIIHVWSCTEGSSVTPGTQMGSHKHNSNRTYFRFSLCEIGFETELNECGVQML